MPIVHTKKTTPRDGAFEWLELAGGQQYTLYTALFTAQRQSQADLGERKGLEVMLKRVTPEIEETVDTNHHAAGKQPFYLHQELAL